MAKPTVDKELISELADLMAKKDLAEVEIEEDDCKLRITRAIAGTAAATPAITAAAAPAPSTGGAGVTESAAHPGAVTSPMVGTVYLSPQPGSPVFVKVGDSVKEGQTLLIIEAMKVMNPIPAPRTGTVGQILISDSQPVEFGEPLMVIE